MIHLRSFENKVSETKVSQTFDDTPKKVSETKVSETKFPKLFMCMLGLSLL